MIDNSDLERAREALVPILGELVAKDSVLGSELTQLILRERAEEAETGGCEEYACGMKGEKRAADLRRQAREVGENGR